VTGLHANVNSKKAEQELKKLVDQEVQLALNEVQLTITSPPLVHAGSGVLHDLQLEEFHVAQVDAFQRLQVLLPEFQRLQLEVLFDAHVEVLKPPLQLEKKKRKVGAPKLMQKGELYALQFVVQALQLLNDPVVQALQLEPLHVLNVVTDSWLTAIPHQLPESVTHNAAPVPLAVSSKSMVTFCLGMSMVARG
jgi:hypothetical protein